MQGWDGLSTCSSSEGLEVIVLSYCIAQHLNLLVSLNVQFCLCSEGILFLVRKTNRKASSLVCTSGKLQTLL